MTDDLRATFSQPFASTKVRAYQGFFAIDRHTIKHPDFPQPLVREVFHRKPAACVLPYDPVLDVVLLVEEFRIGNHAGGFTGSDAVSLGPIAGQIEEGDTPEDTARRESVEEAGLTITGRLHGPVSTMPSPGGTSESIHHFVVETDLSGVQDGERFGLATEGESTRVRIIARADLDPLQLSGQRVPANGLAVTCLFALEAFLARGAITRA